MPQQGGAGGAGFPAGNPGIENPGIEPGQVLAPSYGYIASGGSGGKLGQKGDHGSNNETFSYYGGQGGNPGANGSQGPQGNTGLAILGYNNIYKIINTGSLQGNTTNSISVNYPVTNVAWVSANTSISNSVMMPSSANIGDIAIFFDSATKSSSNSTDAPAKNVPQTWIEICDTVYEAGVLSTDMRATISYKILEANDLHSTLYGMQQPTTKKILMLFRTNEWISNSTPVVITNQNSHSAIANLNVNLTSQTNPLIFCTHYTSDVFLFSGTGFFNPMSNNIVVGEIRPPNSKYQLVKFNNYNLGDSMPNGTIGMLDTAGINIMQSFYIRLE